MNFCMLDSTPLTQTHTESNFGLLTSFSDTSIFAPVCNVIWCGNEHFV
jgi:hypothetical protein